MENIIEISVYDTSWEIACTIINAKRVDSRTAIPIEENAFEPEDLALIARHLLNYAKVYIKVDENGRMD